MSPLEGQRLPLSDTSIAPRHTRGSGRSRTVLAPTPRPTPGTDVALGPPNLGRMEALAGPVVVVAGVLALAGALKVLHAAPTAGALRAVRLPSSLLLVRVLGLAEIAVGVPPASRSRPLC